MLTSHSSHDEANSHHHSRSTTHMQLDLVTFRDCEQLIMGYVQGKIVQAAMGQGGGVISTDKDRS